MKRQEFQFRSKSERERDVNLEANYRQIGIRSIAAASHAMRRTTPVTQQQQQMQQQAQAKASGAPIQGK